MRTVFDNYECAHVFASGTQDHGRSHNGNLYFTGDTIYSYGSHFPIASRVEDRWLFNADSYSVSTARHQSIVRNALRHVDLLYLPHLDKVLRIAHCSYSDMRVADARDYIRSLRVDIDHISDKIKRMRAQWKIDSAHAEIASLEHAAEYVWHILCKRRGDPFASVERAFKKQLRERKIGQLEAGLISLTKRMEASAEMRIAGFENVLGGATDYHGLRVWFNSVEDATNGIFRDVINVTNRKESTRLMGKDWVAHVEALQAERDVKFAPLHDYMMKARDTYEKRVDSIERERVTLWEAGDVSGTLKGRCRVRVVGDRVQTSQGAFVPLREAIALVRVAARCRKRGEGWKRNGEKLPVGSYQTDVIGKDGSLQIGCHRIPWQSIVECVNRSVPELRDVVAE